MMISNPDYPFSRKTFAGSTPERYAADAAQRFHAAYQFSGKSEPASMFVYKLAKAEWYGHHAVLAVGDLLIDEYACDADKLDNLWHAALWLEAAHERNGNPVFTAYGKVRSECGTSAAMLRNEAKEVA